LTTIERGALAVGSAIGSLINPRRAGMNLCYPESFRFQAPSIETYTILP